MIMAGDCFYKIHINVTEKTIMVNSTHKLAVRSRPEHSACNYTGQNTIAINRILINDEDYLNFTVLLDARYVSNIENVDKDSVTELVNT